MIDKHDNNKDIELKGNNNVIGSKKQDFQSLNANRNNLVSYKDTREIFVSRKGSVFPMETYLDHGKNYITCIINLASHAGVFRGARFSSLPTNGRGMKNELP